MKIRIAAAALAVFLGLTAGPAPVRAESVLNHMAPWLFGPPDTGPKPEDTLQAPFGKDKPAPVAGDEQGIMNMYDSKRVAGKADGVGQPNRSPEQVGEWLMSIVTQAMTIDPQPKDVKKYEQNVANFKSLFIPYALQEYETYLAKNNTLAMLSQNHMKITAFAENEPTLKQEGVLDGSYRWLFSVPVMLTYYDQDTTSLKGTKPTSQSQRVVVNVQIGRVPLSRNADGMMIERWTVSSN